MVVISNEVSEIFKILAMEVKTEQDLFSVLVPRDLLKMIGLNNSYCLNLLLKCFNKTSSIKIEI